MTKSGKWWDLTLDGQYQAEKVREWLKANCEKWAFQKERGEKTGYEHYQCKFCLAERQTLNTIAESLSEAGFTRGHLSMSHQMGNFAYVTKEETRIDGPWRWDDAKIPEWLADEKPEWYQWQKEVINLKPEERKVHVIIDLRGGIGKSYLSNWLAVRGKACKIPVVGNYKDALRAICDRPDCCRYILDVPRAETFTSGMIAALESLKDGHVWDDRYKFTERWMEPPVVIVFCNESPRKDLLSADRWETYMVDESLTLNHI